MFPVTSPSCPGRVINCQSRLNQTRNQQNPSQQWCAPWEAVTAQTLLISCTCNQQTAKLSLPVRKGEVRRKIQTIDIRIHFRTGSTFLNCFSSNLPWLVWWARGVRGVIRKKRFQVSCLAPGRIQSVIPHLATTRAPSPSKNYGNWKVFASLGSSSYVMPGAWAVYFINTGGAMWVWGVLLCFIEKPVWFRGTARHAVPGPPSSQAAPERDFNPIFCIQVDLYGPSVSSQVMNTK